MRVLQVSCWDSVGERFNGRLIHESLRERGHQSEMVVKNVTTPRPGVRAAGNTSTRLIDNVLLRPLQDLLSLQTVLALSTSPRFLTEKIRQVDITHLHIVHATQFFSLHWLPAIAEHSKLVWTLHDPWLTTGHCVHPLDCDRWLSGCGRCPDLMRPVSMRRDHTAFMWRLKQRIMTRTDVQLVVTSRYMRARVQSSPILTDHPCQVIPLGVPLDVFRPRDRAGCRRAMDLPEDGHVIAFRLRGVDEPFKGGANLLRALQVYRPIRPTTLLVFEGGAALDPLRERYMIRELGWLDDAITVANALNAADVFVMPSAAEAFGLMAVEAMACGTPVIVCDGTALPEVVMAPEGGMAVPQGDPEMLADAMRKLLGNDERRRSLGERAAELAHRHYSFDSYMDRHIELYNHLLGDDS